MERNPYASPAARVEDVQPLADSGAPPFFPVSVPKLAVLSICSFGLYELFWFYQKCVEA
ncbi:MAG: hypothetical protein LBV49_02235 [Azonexus sp.]|nr:hypothetical protein [Azonexus sp.]